MDRSAIAGRALGLIDLTNLNDDCTAQDIEVLCSRAQTPHGNTAAVCIWPRFVSQAKRLLADTPVKVATVVNFPAGGSDVKATMRETKQVVSEGADEVDLVIPIDALKSGDTETARHMVSTIRAVTHNQALLKVIIEAGELSQENLIREASVIALEEGADFIKTSTGKVRVNATPEYAEIMLDVLSDFGDKARGFKPAGGIRTVEDCGTYLEIADRLMGADWATRSTFRFGASGVLTDVLAALDGNRAETSDGY